MRMRVAVMASLGTPRALWMVSEHFPGWYGHRRAMSWQEARTFSVGCLGSPQGATRLTSDRDDSDYGSQHGSSSIQNFSDAPGKPVEISAPSRRVTLAHPPFETSVSR